MPGDVVSSHFRSVCRHAAKAGPGAYEPVGKLLVWHAIEHSCSTQRLVELIRLMKAGDDRALFAWLQKHYPKHLMLIPAPKTFEVLRGVYACRERLELSVLPRRLEEQEGGSTPLLTVTKRSRPFLARLRPSVN